MKDAGCMGLKLFFPAVNHGAGDPKFLTHFFLRRITPHAFQHYLEFELWRITLAFVVHVIQYLSLLLCCVESHKVVPIGLSHEAIPHKHSTNANRLCSSGKKGKAS